MKQVYPDTMKLSKSSWIIPSVFCSTETEKRFTNQEQHYSDPRNTSCHVQGFFECFLFFQLFHKHIQTPGPQQGQGNCQQHIDHGWNPEF